MSIVVVIHLGACRWFLTPVDVMLSVRSPLSPLTIEPLPKDRRRRWFGPFLGRAPVLNGRWYGLV